MKTLILIYDETYLIYHENISNTLRNIWNSWYRSHNTRMTSDLCLNYNCTVHDQGQVSEHITVCHPECFYFLVFVSASPQSLMRLCRLQILQFTGRRRVKKLPLPGVLIRFLQHQEHSLDDWTSTQTDPVYLVDPVSPVSPVDPVDIVVTLYLTVR